MVAHFDRFVAFSTPVDHHKSTRHMRDARGSRPLERIDKGGVFRNASCSRRSIHKGVIIVNSSVLLGVVCCLSLGIAHQASMAATFDVVTDFNNTGVQPAPGNPHTFPFTYGTETSLNTGFALIPNFQPNGTC